MSPSRIGPRKPHRHFIREWMKAKSLTQEQLAGRLGITQGAVSKMLKSAKMLTEDKMIGIAEALDLDVPDLFRDPEQPTQAELLEGLTEAERQTVLTMVKALRHTG